MESLRVMLNRCLEKIAAGEKIEGVEFTKLAIEFDSALNNSFCPCESGKIFSDCCKASWNALKRGMNQWRESEFAEKKQEHQEEVGKQEVADVMDRGVKWMYRIGVSKEGGLVGLPTDEGRSLSPVEIGGMLLTLYHQLMISFIQSGIQFAINGGKPSLTMPKDLKIVR